MSEREIEVPWAIANTVGPVLDVGCAESTYLDQLDGPVDGIDSRHISHPALRNFFHADIRTAKVDERYATVLAVSTIEHIGLACEEYETEADDEDGDLHALRVCVDLCAPGGKVLMSVPYGPSHENRGWYRRYDRDTLHDLCSEWDYEVEPHLNPDWGVGGVALVTVKP